MLISLNLKYLLSDSYCVSGYLIGSHLLSDFIWLWLQYSDFNHSPLVGKIHLSNP